MTLRKYQTDAVFEIESNWIFGVRKVLWYSPTGSGKGHVLAEIIRNYTGRVLFVVRGRELVKQGSKRISDVDHGVLMAGHPMYNPSKRVQVCSIDTMSSRKEYPPADLIIVDEVHMASCASYRNMAENYVEANILGVTATPYTNGSLEHVADVIVNTANIQELIDAGFLVPPKYFAKHQPDLKGVKISAGEYNQTDLEQAMMKSDIYGDALVEWREIGENRPTLGFCTSVNHSKAMCEVFNNSGIPSAHMDANTPDDQRLDIINASKIGDIKVLWSVRTLTTGVDLPWISCVIDLAPTMSLILNDQKLGRGTRPAPGKYDFIVLDHAGNVFRHDDIRTPRQPTIKGKPKKEPGEAPVKTCTSCYAVVPISINVCPDCGQELGTDKRLKKMKVVDGRLVPIPPPPKIIDPYRELRKAMKRKFKTAFNKGYKRGWVYHQLVKKYGHVETSKVWKYTNSLYVDQSDFD